MKTKLLMCVSMGILVLLFSGCAEDNYNAGYNNNYDNRSYNDKEIDNVIATEMNSLSDADIAALNTLK